jgi:hypothetical protein
VTRIVHLELFCGASGDMMLGALIDAGVPRSAIEDAIGALGLPLALRVERVVKRGIAATHVEVEAPHEHVHRHLADIDAIITRSPLDADIKGTALRAFRALAEAEAAVHGIDVEAVHFHEVGALDAIADVVGVCAGFAHLGPQQMHCRTWPMSHGTVRCAHGVLPVPAPAVVRLLEGMPAEPLDVSGETVTPTAAALLRVLVTDWRAPPAFTITHQGYGAGRKDFPRANVLRLTVGECAAAESTERLTCLECNLDDMNPEWLPPLLERLIAAGARDAWVTPIVMKKGRPAYTLSVLCDAALAPALRALVYRHSTTLGVRETTLDRHSVPRRIESVTTPFGTIAVKIATLPDGTERGAPEFDHCEAASRASGAPLEEIYAAALRAWQSSRH